MWECVSFCRNIEQYSLLLLLLLEDKFQTLGTTGRLCKVSCVTHVVEAVAGDDGEAVPDGARLVPMKTTNTAEYAAVAARTSLPVLSLAPNASSSANKKMATEVVPRLKFRL